MGIVESWANNDSSHVTDAELRLPGHEMFRKDRMGSREEGVLFYTKEHTKYIYKRKLIAKRHYGAH